MARKTYRRLFRRARRALPLLALMGFLAGTIGVPLPHLARPVKDRSRPYPCMDHACGCLSAEQCWHSCCCFTNREKLAWAAEHGVTPPAFLVAAAAHERPAAAISGCCAAKHALAECDVHDASCCDHDGHDEVAASVGSEFGVTFVVAIQARQCQGQAELWLALGAVTLPPPPFAIQHNPAFAGDAVVLGLPLIGISERPATPPPRA